MCAVGTRAFETMASGNEDDQSHALGRLGTLRDDAEAAAAPREGVAEEPEDGEAAEGVEDPAFGAPADEKPGARDERRCR